MHVDCTLFPLWPYLESTQTPLKVAEKAHVLAGLQSQKRGMLAARFADFGYNLMIEKDKILVAYCTCPNSEVAETIARALVTEQLAACVNQLAGVRSIYRWQGQIQTDTEVMLIIKTTQSQLAKLTARLLVLHPYELPELIALPVCGGSERYIDWVRQTVTA